MDGENIVRNSKLHCVCQFLKCVYVMYIVKAQPMSEIIKFIDKLKSDIIWMKVWTGKIPTVFFFFLRYDFDEWHII